MPRFEGFFKSMSEGKHPFEEEKFDYKGFEKTAEQLAEEEQYD